MYSSENLDAVSILSNCVSLSTPVQGRPPLLWATESGSPEMVKILLDNFADDRGFL